MWTSNNVHTHVLFGNQMPAVRFRSRVYSCKKNPRRGPLSQKEEVTTRVFNGLDFLRCTRPTLTCAQLLACNMATHVSCYPRVGPAGAVTAAGARGERARQRLLPYWQGFHSPGSLRAVPVCRSPSARVRQCRSIAGVAATPTFSTGTAPFSTRYVCSVYTPVRVARYVFSCACLWFGGRMQRNDVNMCAIYRVLGSSLARSGGAHTHPSLSAHLPRAHAYTHVHTHTHTHTHTKYIRIHIHTRTQAHSLTHTHAYMHSHTHAHKHTHTHTRTLIMVCHAQFFCLSHIHSQHARTQKHVQTYRVTHAHAHT